jgi:hypothetical protein
MPHSVLASFLKDWFMHSKVERWGYADRQHGNVISLLSFNESKESGLENRMGPQPIWTW